MMEVSTRHPAWHRLASAAVVGMVAVFWPGALRPACGEWPSWQEVRTPLYAVAHHSYSVNQPTKREGKQGIWAFDPMQKSWRRVAPLLYNAFGLASPLRDSGGSILVASNDELLFQGVGAWLAMKPAEGRVLRRFAPGFINGAWGWNVVGPLIGETDGSMFGPAPGVFGFPTCTAIHLGFQGASLPGCNPIAFPEGTEPDNPLRILLLARQPAQQAQATALADL